MRTAGCLVGRKRGARQHRPVTFRARYDTSVQARRGCVAASACAADRDLASCERPPQLVFPACPARRFVSALADHAVAPSAGGCAARAAARAQEGAEEGELRVRRSRQAGARRRAGARPCIPRARNRCAGVLCSMLMCSAPPSLQTVGTGRRAA